jgi:hypothetical protein
MNGLKEMAEQAGMHYRRIEDEFCKANTDGVPMEMLKAFAKLVAAKEREACAYIAEGYPKYGESIAEEIRARA